MHGSQLIVQSKFWFPPCCVSGAHICVYKCPISTSQLILKQSKFWFPPFRALIFFLPAYIPKARLGLIFHTHNKYLAVNLTLILHHIAPPPSLFIQIQMTIGGDGALPGPRRRRSSLATTYAMTKNARAKSVLRSRKERTVPPMACIAKTNRKRTGNTSVLHVVRMLLKSNGASPSYSIRECMFT